MDASTTNPDDTLSTITLFVRRGLVHGDTNSTANGEGTGMLHQRLGLFIFLVAFGFALAIVLTVAIREYYLRKYGVDVCPGIGNRQSQSHSRHVNRNQIQTDEELAQELQRQLNEETREQDRLEKRKERREWYVSYIKPYTMEVQEKDFFYAKETTTTTTEPTTLLASVLTETTDASGDFSTCSTDSTEPNDDDDDDSTGEESSSDEELLLSGEMEIASTSTTPRVDTNTSTTTESSSSSSTAEPQTTTTMTCCETEAHLSIRLPVTCSKNTGNLRTVDAHCAICLGEYEAGEKIVWSSLLQCQHAFHHECILPWLSKGKKRCPICRHWFVPGTKIDDQKAALQATGSSDDSESGNSNNGTARAARERSSTASTLDDEEMEDSEIAVANATPATEPESVAPPETTTRTTTAEVDYAQPNALEQVGNGSQDGGEQPPDIENGLQQSLSVDETL